MAQENKKIVAQGSGREQKIKTPEERVKLISGADLTEFTNKVSEFAAGTGKFVSSKPDAHWDKIWDSAPQKPSGWVSHEDKMTNYRKQASSRMFLGNELSVQLQGESSRISSQSLDIQKEFQERAQKQLDAIQKGTLEQYERGLLQGQTVQEVASAQRASRVGYINEAANQQRASLFSQNQYQQQQLQQQGEQSQLKLQQLTGARGIGGSSVEDQILNRQRSETAAGESQAQEQLGAGLSQIAESKSKQIAEINADINKDMQQRQTDMQNSFDTKNQQARQNIIEQQQIGITQVQNAYLAKKQEIQKMVDQVQQQINTLQTESVSS